jgi:hypothetical protein
VSPLPLPAQYRDFTPRRHSLLTSLCDALAWLRLKLHNQQHPYDGKAHSNAFVASAEELTLLRQLDACPAVPSSCSSAVSGVDDMQSDPAAANKYKTAAHEQQQQQQQDSRSQLEDQTHLATSSGTPAAHSSSGQAVSADRSVSSSFCGLDSGNNRAVSGPWQQQQQLALMSAPKCHDLQPQQAAPSAAAAAAAAATIAPAGDPLWLLRHLLSEDQGCQHVPRGFGGTAGVVSRGPARLSDVQAAAANR